MTHLRPVLAAVLVAFAVLPSVGGTNLIGQAHTQVCDYVNDTCSALPDLPPDCPDAVCANPCLEEADCVPTCPDEVCQPCGGGCNVPCPVNDCSPECPNTVCQNPCVASLTGGVDATGGPTTVCGVPVPTCAIDVFVPAVCGIPVPLPCGITFDTQPSGNDPTIPDEACGIGLPCPGTLDSNAPCGTPQPCAGTTTASICPSVSPCSNVAAVTTTACGLNECDDVTYAALNVDCNGATWGNPYHALAAENCGGPLFQQTIASPPQPGQTVCCPSKKSPQDDHWTVIDYAPGTNYKVWVLRLTYIGYSDAVEYRVGWNNDYPQSIKGLTGTLRTVAGGTGFLEHNTVDAASGLCGNILYDSGCKGAGWSTPVGGVASSRLPCVVDVNMEFAGDTQTVTHSTEESESDTVTWSHEVSIARTFGIDLSLSGPSVSSALSASYTLGFTSSHTETFTTGTSVSDVSTMQVFHQDYTS